MKCCDGKYSGEIEVIQNKGTITGKFRDLNGNDTGSFIGDVQGDKVTFTRTFEGNKKQVYWLTLSSDSRSMKGILAGDRDKSVGVDVICTRKSKLVNRKPIRR
jgi:hypothetical protein